MEKSDNRKHLSLLEGISSEEEAPRGKTRRAKANAIEAKGRRSMAADDAEGAESASTSQQVASGTSLLNAPGEQELRDRSPATPTLRADSTAKISAAPTFELPQRRSRRRLGGLVSFLMFVLLPTALAAVYYLVYASNQYVVQFSFNVRDTNTSVSTSAVAATAGLSASLGLTSSPNPTENYMVVEYMTSRQAVDDLQKKINVRQLYSYPFIDFWARLDASEPVERFVKYWKDVVTAEFDQLTGISSAEVRAFTPADAYLIANTLVSSADEMINEVSQRPLREAVRYAEAEVKRSEDRLKQLRADLSAYREKEGLIEPLTSVVLSNATVASTIRGTLAQLQTEMANLKIQGLGPKAPPVLALQTRIKATEDQLKLVENEVSTKKGGSSSAISPVVARYEQLDLERQFAQATLTSTMQSWEQARANAVTKRLYIVSFIAPALPQRSTYPNRVVAILTAAAACLMLWTIGLLLSRSIKEHLT
jgi:capsular polysaccharide transport system permease protein